LSKELLRWLQEYNFQFKHYTSPTGSSYFIVFFGLAASKHPRHNTPSVTLRVSDHPGLCGKTYINVNDLPKTQAALEKLARKLRLWRAGKVMRFG
jgi:hypothetical protein